MQQKVHATTGLKASLSIALVLFAAHGEAATTQEAPRLYGEFCSVCHGERGDGNTHARQGLSPPPRDFTSTGLAQQLTRERMIDVVSNGKPGTAMVGWHDRLGVDQIQAIVDYIRATFMIETPIATVDRGETIYAGTCSVCHGEQGTGAVWGRTSLNPPPVDFTRADPDRVLTRERMLASVTHGRPGTAMMAFTSQLSAADIEAVVDYIRNSFMRSGDQVPAPAYTVNRQAANDIVPPAHTIDLTLPMPDGLTGNSDNGRAFYMQNCVTCHGAAGDGQGPRAYFIFPKPRNFTEPASRSRFNRPALFVAVRDGVRGREMPAWGKVLDEQQIADVAEYVFQTFIRDEARGAN